MPRLIVESENGNFQATIGGTPFASPGTQWSYCSCCKSPMQFLAQFPLNKIGIPSLSNRNQHLLLFQCQNDPGMCDEWDPDSGGNAAVLVSSEDLVAMEVPSGTTLLSDRSLIDFQEYDDTPEKETPDDNYYKALNASEIKVLGKAGGKPPWIQGDETPTCSCGEPMQFIAMLEERGGGGINFGGAGAGYVFICIKCTNKAKLLSQC